MRTATLLMLLAIAACPPTLSGEPCDLSLDDCPAGQVCTSTSAGPVCKSGTALADGGQDGGLNGDGGADGGGNGGTTFAGIVTLNGGAVPIKESWVYQFGGPPMFDATNHPKGYLI